MAITLSGPLRHTLEKPNEAVPLFKNTLAHAAGRTFSKVSDTAGFLGISAVGLTSLMISTKTVMATLYPATIQAEDLSLFSSRVSVGVASISLISTCAWSLFSSFSKKNLEKTSGACSFVSALACKVVGLGVGAIACHSAALESSEYPDRYTQLCIAICSVWFTTLATGGCLWFGKEVIGDIRKHQLSTDVSNQRLQEEIIPLIQKTTQALLSSGENLKTNASFIRFLQSCDAFVLERPESSLSKCQEAAKHVTPTVSIVV